MKIIKKAFEWARPLTPLNLSSVSGIALHHMDHATAGMDEIHQWHLAKGWKGFAYNYWIDFEGNTYECRGLNAGGGLYDPLNDTILSIGFQGDYSKTKQMPAAQFNAGVELISYLKSSMPTINTVDGHKHWQDNTSCPGQYFPLSKMIDAVNGVSIMGKSELSVEQMRKFLREINPNAPEIEQLYLDEGEIEGVRGDIAFCQAIHETNYFRFTGTAKIEWNNPAGLGVTGPAGVGNRFPNWQEGIRAQIQHLKAYAKKYPAFNTAIVDPRYEALVKAGYSGMAPRWTDLNGKWAYPGTTYGQAILSLYQKVSAIRIESDSEKVKLLTVEIESLKSENTRLHNILNEIQDILNKR